MSARLACIEKFVVEHGGGVQYMGVETIFKGKAGERSPSGTTIVEFKSRTDRELFLSTVSITDCPSILSALLQLRNSRRDSPKAHEIDAAIGMLIG